jgi:hypothetical protein
MVLLAAAYARLVLKYLSFTPDISLTVLNPCVPTPTGETTLRAGKSGVVAGLTCEDRRCVAQRSGGCYSVGCE